MDEKYPRLRGLKRAARLDHLREVVDQNYKAAEATGKKFLDYARATGEALQEAFVRTGRGRGGWWRIWVNSTALKGVRGGSMRTAQQYRQIFNNWEHIKEAILAGHSVTSIRQAVALLKGTKERSKVDIAKSEIIKGFTVNVRAILEDEHVFKLNDEFDRYWRGLRAAIRHDVRDDKLREKMKRQVRQLGQKLLNAGRNGEPE